MSAVLIDVVVEALGGRARSIVIRGGEGGPVVPPQRVPRRPHSPLLKVIPNVEGEVISDVIINIMVNLKSKSY